MTFFLATNRHWEIEFKRDMYWSYTIKREQLPKGSQPAPRTYDDGFAADGGSVRGDNLYSASELQSCKVCDTIAPTFLARTKALKAFPFRTSLDGDW